VGEIEAQTERFGFVSPSHPNWMLPGPRPLKGAGLT